MERLLWRTNYKRGMQDFGIKQALKYLEKDPEENIPKLMEMVDRFAPQGWYEGQRNMIRKVIQEKGNWYELILRLYELDPGVRKAFFQNFIFNASLNGSALQDQLSQENNCNIPWAILLDSDISLQSALYRMLGCRVRTSVEFKP